MNFSIVKTALISVFAVASIQFAQAKPALKISFDRLKSDSGIVAIVRCIRASRVQNDKFEQKHYGQYVLQLEVVSMFKGEGDRILRVEHFQDLVEKGASGNPPSSMYFGKAAFKTIRELKIGQSSKVNSIDSYHLVFLQKSLDQPGFLVPITGHTDALQSTYELIDKLQYMGLSRDAIITTKS